MDYKTCLKLVQIYVTFINMYLKCQIMGKKKLEIIEALRSYRAPSGSGCYPNVPHRRFLSTCVPRALHGTKGETIATSQ